jgi:hypothetical protein
LASCNAEVVVPLLQRLSTDADCFCWRFAVMGLANHRTDAAFEGSRLDG